MAVRSRVRVSVRGGAETRNNLLRMFQNIRTTGHLNAYNAAQHLFARTRAIVPYEDGTLYNAAYSKKVEASDKKAIWEVGYDMQAAPHALIQHETPEYNHPTRGPSAEPKTDHFLSKPRDAMEKAYAKTVADDVWGAIKSTRVTRVRGR